MQRSAGQFNREKRLAETSPGETWQASRGDGAEGPEWRPTLKKGRRTIKEDRLQNGVREVARASPPDLINARNTRALVGLVDMPISRERAASTRRTRLSRPLKFNRNAKPNNQTTRQPGPHTRPTRTRLPALPTFNHPQRHPVGLSMSFRELPLLEVGNAAAYPTVIDLLRP